MISPLAWLKRRRPRLRLVLTLLLFVACWLSTAAAAVSRAATLASGRLGDGTAWETAWYSIDSGAAGPTVIVTGGMHGNEPGGFRAAEQIRHWPIVAGRLVVIPRVNRLGLAADMRWIPEFRNDRALRDANRNFPTKDRLESQTPLCAAIWEFIGQQKPDWVFDLHEGFDVHRENSRSVGSSVIAFPKDARFAAALVAAVNADIDPARQFEMLAESGPARGSLARACQEQLAAASFILETTFKDQPVSLRTRQHRRMMSYALREIGLTEQDCTDILLPAESTGRIRVAVFDAEGANESAVFRLLDLRDDLSASHVGPADIKPEVLSRIDVLVFPGGSGSRQGRALGEERREHVRRFVREGGGVVGICAGAYLCSSHYDWSLCLMNAAVFNQSVEIPGAGRKSMWYRGPPANVEVEVTAEGAKILGFEGTRLVRYQNGPILSPGSHPRAPAYQPLAFFRTENVYYEPQKNTMIGSPAVVSSRFEKGRVLGISPHFESTAGQEAVLLNAIRHVARTGLVE